MYADPSYTYDYGNGPEPYCIGPDGPYTHYVDPGHPNATDTNNPYGTHTMPRVTRPNAIANLPAGSVMEMHSGWQPGVGPIYGSGTPTQPIFIRGVPGDEPTFTAVFSIRGDYIVMENLKFDLEDYARRTILIGDYEGARTHVAIRGCEFYNGDNPPGSSYQAIMISHNFETTAQIDNIVIYNNHFHNMGDGRTGGKADAIGVGVRVNANNIWIIDNDFSWIGGDGIQLDSDVLSGSETPPHHIYIGRNIFHDIFENAVDLKNCQHIILSQNVAYNFGPAYTTLTNPAAGQSAFRYGGQDIPVSVPREYIWTIFNEVYNSDCTDGAFMSYSTENVVEPLADNIYYIGNVVHDSHNAGGTSAAFRSWSQQRIYWINNLTYNCDTGGMFSGLGNESQIANERIVAINNVFGKRHSGANSDTFYSYNFGISGSEDSINRAILNNNLLFDGDRTATIKVQEWYNDGTYKGWIPYNLSEFMNVFPNQSQGSIEADPLHLDADGGDFRLLSNSPAIDAGTVHDYFDRFYNLYGIDISVDFEGNSIPQGSAPDIGAYEYKSGDEIRPGDTLPDKTELTCYNNVFNPAKGEKALIVVELPKQAHIRLNLYNTRRHRIRELADEEKEADTYKYYWDGRNDSGNVVGSGLYFVHIQAGDYKKTKKIVVVK